EGKNIYPEDVEAAFGGIAAKEFCVFAANYLWPARTMTGEKLVIAIHLEPGQSIDEKFTAALADRNRRLLNYKRVSAYFLWAADCPRTASLKIKRPDLAEQIRAKIQRDSTVPL